ncbi:hypothetical protein BAUCODRAFT_313075 [Baudoinia panamericana UAMH 10762]|uniref:Uncharacterized protein n=1 Tax=Baudoinia panamericana (strain UAMH 10762) TaxID=717646 RepID=M2N0B0_BAUPA|nr:uncharacterized protein BAUCODRAFT_313075 [Baudoinia panamericana UAMH 10762]EMC92000.1 hypothetical protein BAUCODRAFT_313075 [Baudoinia panamericana UAMH 10762]
MGQHQPCITDGQPLLPPVQTLPNDLGRLRLQETVADETTGGDIIEGRTSAVEADKAEAMEDETGPIVRSLITHPLDDDLDFKALSYVWGDRKD